MSSEWGYFRWGNLTTYGRVGLVAYLSCIGMVFGSFGIAITWRERAPLWLVLGLLVGSIPVGMFGLQRLVRRNTRTRDFLYQSRAFRHLDGGS